MTMRDSNIRGLKTVVSAILLAMIVVGAMASCSSHTDVPGVLEEQAENETPAQEESNKLAEGNVLATYEAAKPAAAQKDSSTQENTTVARKLITSFHMTYSSRERAEETIDEWVSASYNNRGRIERKEIKRETPFVGWEKEPNCSLAFSYDEAGRLTKVSGTESYGGQATDSDGWTGAVNWDITYDADGKACHASGTEYGDRRYIDEVRDDGGDLITLDYLIRAGQIAQSGALNFSYDSNGRMVGQSARNMGYNGSQPSKGGYNMSVSYDSASRITSIETFDADGKMYSRHTYDYDGVGRLARRGFVSDGGGSGLAVSQTYAYNEDGHLVSASQNGNDKYGESAQATFVTDGDGSIVKARVEGEKYVRTYEVEYTTVRTPKGQEPVNAVDLTDPFNPDLNSDLWVSHTNLDPTPFDESAFLRENRRWLELHKETVATQTDKGSATTAGERPYVLRYDLNGLKVAGGNGDVGDLYVPGTVGEFEERYGEESPVETISTSYYTHRARLPKTDLAVLFMFGGNDRKSAEAQALEGALGDLVGGIGDEPVSLAELAEGLRSATGDFDAEGLVPSGVAGALEKRGLCYVEGRSGTIYYADGSSGVRELHVETDAEGKVDARTAARVSVYASIYQ